MDRNCWLDSKQECKCKEKEVCPFLILKYAKLVYCNDKNCLWNMDIPYKFIPDRGKKYKPFKDDVFTGICSRNDIALSPHDIKELKVKRGLTTCSVRSDKSLKRPHFPHHDKIEGGLYDDHTSDWVSSAFHFASLK